MKVLSLFDGIACGYEALKRAGIPIDVYYASEIDKHAIKVAKANHPDIIEIWDVCQVEWDRLDFVDLVIGWSPCQGFSMAGKMLNFSDPRSKLFFEFVRLVKECKPKFFLLENVKMKKEYIEVINEQLRWITPTLIDSALVSAQHRERNYRVGKLQEDGTYAKVEIAQPEDEHVMLEDILEKEVDSKYILTPAQIEMIANWGWYEDPIASADKWVEKIGTLTTHCGKMSNGIKLIRWNWGYRKLTPVECERLQTLPDNYTSAAADTQRYIQLWNGWTCDIIAHIFRNLFW